MATLEIVTRKAVKSHPADLFRHREFALVMKGLLFFVATVAVVGWACHKNPTASPAVSDVPRGTPVLVERAPKPELKGQLLKALAAYEQEPNSDRVSVVWEAFMELDHSITQLKARVAKEAGGLRAEAEIQRIELQRFHDEQMSRFAAAQSRVAAARAALDALEASVEAGAGVQSAAAMLVHGRGRDVRDGLRDVGEARVSVR